MDDRVLQGESMRLREPEDARTVAIHGEDGKPVVTFRQVDGVLCAEYDEDRVDEAAQTLLDVMNRLAAGAVKAETD